VNRNVQRTLPVILSIISSVGVVATGILVALEAEKANKNIRKAKEKKDKKAIVVAFLKGYYPALLVGGATVSSIIAGTIISKRIEMSLTATALMLDASLKKYKGKLKELFGDKASVITDSIIKDDYNKLTKDDKELEDGEILYCEEHVGFFKAIPSKLEHAMGQTNEKIITTLGWSSIREFLKDAKARLISDNGIDDVSFDYGWYLDYVNEVSAKIADGIIDVTNSPFIHMTIEPHGDENGVFDYYILKFDRDPIFGVTQEHVSRLGGYRTSSLEEYEEYIREKTENRDEDAAALLYDELKELKKTKKRTKTNGKDI